jgi:hypothetical protein
VGRVLLGDLNHLVGEVDADHVIVQAGKESRHLTGPASNVRDRALGDKFDERLQQLAVERLAVELIGQGAVVVAGDGVVGVANPVLRRSVVGRHSEECAHICRDLPDQRSVASTDQPGSKSQAGAEA